MSNVSNLLLVFALVLMLFFTRIYLATISANMVRCAKVRLLLAHRVQHWASISPVLRL